MHLPPARGITLVAVLALLLSGCGVFGSDDSSSGSSPSSSPSAPKSSSPTASLTPSPPASGSAGGSTPALASFYRQKLAWKSCRGSDRCATLRVPLDYAHPTAKSIGISVLKVPAAGKKIGSMVINPGGPGGSGVDYAATASFDTAIKNAYDIVGFDPRGVVRSDPVQCESSKQFNTLLSSDPDPDTAKERAYSDRLLRRFGQGCITRSGGIARHMSTVEVAKDMDVLRAALGDSKLTYFGASYGTFIGATYADLFPRRVGRMVLDGALDPTSSTLRLNLIQAGGFETALRAYVGACVDRGSCFLGSTVDQGTRRIRRFLDAVEKQPLPTNSSRKVDVGNAVFGINLPLYNKAGWPILDRALQNAFKGDGSVLMALADGYLSRNADNTFKDNSFQALFAVNCLDHDDAVKESQLKRVLPRFLKASPTFGASFAYSATTCAQWPVHTGNGPTALHAKGAPPIVVVGTTRDPATPLVWAQGLARQLDSGRLITRDGDGHTGYGQGSSCVDSAVDAYVVSGKVPKDGLKCS